MYVCMYVYIFFKFIYVYIYVATFFSPKVTGGVWTFSFLSGGVQVWFVFFPGSLGSLASNLPGAWLFQLDIWGFP